jgi:predicted nucleic acid-binding protein
LKTIQSFIDAERHKKEVALNLFDLSGLTSDSPLPKESSSLVFLDTNILLWLYRINNDARAEVLYLLNAIKQEQRLCIPSWVVHEYNYHVAKRDDSSFFPFKKSAKEIESRLKLVEQHSKLIIDDDYLKGSKYHGKNNFLDELEETANKLRSLLKALTSSRNKNLDDIQVQIEELMTGCVLESNINELMVKSSDLANLRARNRVPPGFLDEGKPENEHGDYIIWQEVVLICKKEQRSALLITNDRKPDWVYTPRILLDQSGKRKPNDGSADVKIDLPLPFLESEFESLVAGNHKFMLSNIEFLSHLCSSATFNPKEFDKYENLAKAVSVETKHDDTYLVISWFLNNNEKLHNAIKTVAYWEYSPSQIDDVALSEFIKNNIPNIDINKVDIGEVICELFI